MSDRASPIVYMRTKAKLCFKRWQVPPYKKLTAEFSGRGFIVSEKDTSRKVMGIVRKDGRLYMTDITSSGRWMSRDWVREIVETNCR